VDYFHKKFKKYVGVSPAEYRKSLESENISSEVFNTSAPEDYEELDSISISNAS
jgi:AraC-like DNA-binding protein